MCTSCTKGAQIGCDILLLDSSCSAKKEITFDEDMF